LNFSRRQCRASGLALLADGYLPQSSSRILISPGKPVLIFCIFRGTANQQFLRAELKKRGMLRIQLIWKTAADRQNSGQVYKRAKDGVADEKTIRQEEINKLMIIRMKKRWGIA